MILLLIVHSNFGVTESTESIKVRKAEQFLKEACDRNSIHLLKRLWSGDFQLATGILYRDLQDLHNVLGVKMEYLKAFTFDSSLMAKSHDVPVLFSSSIVITPRNASSQANTQVLRSFLDIYSKTPGYPDETKIGLHSYVTSKKNMSDGYCRAYWVISKKHAFLKKVSFLYGQVPFAIVRPDWSPWK